MVVDSAQGETQRRQRVPALSPQERRAALVAATIPLLREHGAGVSTRQIADAAGVAEGTIFGVFKDKATLLRAAVVAGLDPVPLLQALRAVDPELDLRERLVVAARLVREHVAGHGALFFLVRGPLFRELASGTSEPGRELASGTSEPSPELASGTSEPGVGHCQATVDLMTTRYLVLNELTNLIEPDAVRLRRSPAIAARLLLSLVGSPRGAFGMLDEDLEDTDVVSLVLDGLLVRPQETTTAPPREA